MKSNEELAREIIRPFGDFQQHLGLSTYAALVRAGRTVGQREGEIKALRWIMTIPVNKGGLARYVNARIAELEKEQADAEC